MKIEIWSDYVCPFCYIGKRNLENALKQLGMTDEAELVFRSFELDPEAPKRYDGTIHELIAKKYGLSVESARENNDRVVLNAMEAGLMFNFDDLKPTNTFDAHRLSYYAKEKGRIVAFNEAVMRSYFTDSLDISDVETLSSLAAEVGLDKDEAKRILASADYANEVRESERVANSKGIDGVPFFIFDGKETLYGAHAVETFVNVITAVKNNEPIL